MSEPKVSVVVTTYNNRRYVAESVASVLGGPGVEVIVVDDGSTDETGGLVRREFGDRVRYLYRENGGSAAARNTGIRAARGGYVAFLDGDDVSAPDRLALQAEVLDARPEVGLVYGNIAVIDSEGKGGRVRGGRSRYLSGQVFESIIIKNFVPFSTIMARKDDLCSIGMFDETLRSSEDWEMLIRLSRRTRFHYVDRPLVKYRVHRNSKGADIAGKQRAYQNIQRKIFSEYDLGPSAARLRRRSDATLKLSLASLSLRHGHPVKAAGYALAGALTSPSAVLSMRYEIASRLRLS